MAIDVDALAQRIRQRRGDRTQAEVAKVAGISVVTLQKLEYGSTRSPDVLTLDGVAHALGVTVPWLLYGDEGPELTLEAVVERWSALMPDIPREGVEQMIRRVLAMPAQQRDALLADLDALRASTEAVEREKAGASAIQSRRRRVRKSLA